MTDRADLDNPRGHPDLTLVQRYVANIAISGSTLRNQGAGGVVKTAQDFLADLDLGYLKGRELDDYLKWLNEETHTLQGRFPDGAQKWGSARKAINIFMCHAFMNRVLSESYDLTRLGVVMETPLDSRAAKKLCEWAGKGVLPTWLGVGNLDANDSEKYQDIALKMAESLSIPRAFLDVLLWP